MYHRCTHIPHITIVQSACAEFDSTMRNLKKFVGEEKSENWEARNARPQFIWAQTKLVRRIRLQPASLLPWSCLCVRVSLSCSQTISAALTNSRPLSLILSPSLHSARGRRCSSCYLSPSVAKICWFEGCDCDIKMKRTKSKKPKAEHENNVVEKEKASFKPKKMGSEIDEIFAAKKRKRLENEKKGEDEKAGKVVAANARPLDKKKRNSSKTRSFEQNSFADRISQQKKKTADGLTIFTEEELGIGKPDAGGTALCPFDCDCCF